MSTTLNVDVREKLGSRHARALRAAGKIPASLQHSGAEPHVNLTIDEEEFLTSRRQHQHLYELQLGGKVVTALVNHLDWDVFGERIAHVEFRRVDRHAKTDVTVPIEFVGTPKSGLLVHIETELVVRTTPDNIPDSVKVLAGDLEPGDAVTAGQVILPEGVALGEDVAPEDVLARVETPRVVEAASPAAAEEGAAEGAAAEAEGEDKDEDKEERD